MIEIMEMKMHDTIKIIRVWNYKAGYQIRQELVDFSDFGGTDMIMRRAYNPNGEYIGNHKTAWRLCNMRGIAPEKANPSHNVCSIWFCKKDQKWYGYSHRAIYGFGVGSKCKIGDCHYNPSNRQEFLADLQSWYNDSMHKNLRLTPEPTGVRVSYEIHPKGGGRIISYNELDKYPTKWGHGAWTAKTLADAKQMAIDFASDVS